jgi:hypothetical protein
MKAGEIPPSLSKIQKIAVVDDEEFAFNPIRKPL